MIIGFSINHEILSIKCIRTHNITGPVIIINNADILARFPLILLLLTRYSSTIRNVYCIEIIIYRLKLLRGLCLPGMRNVVNIWLILLETRIINIDDTISSYICILAILF